MRSKVSIPQRLWLLVVAGLLLSSCVSDALRIGSDVGCQPSIFLSSDSEDREAYVRCTWDGTDENTWNGTVGLTVFSESIPYTVLSVKLNSDDAVKEVGAALKDSRWKPFFNKDDTGKGPSAQHRKGLGIFTPSATCSDEIVAQCWCQGEGDGSQARWQTSRSRKVKVHIRPRVSLTATTPLWENWSRGTQVDNWIGARCVAACDVTAVRPEIYWVVHTGKEQETVYPGDDRVYMRRDQNFTHYANKKLELLDSKCMYHARISSINFKAKGTHHPLSLECRLVSQTARNVDVMLGNTKTPFLNIISPVDENNTHVKVAQDSKSDKGATVYKCYSHAFPYPSYTWWEHDKPDVALNESQGPEPAYLDISKVVSANSHFICNATNIIGTTKYRVAIRFNAKLWAGDDRPDTEASMEDGYVYIEHDTTALPGTLLAVGSVVGLVGFVLVLVKEQRDLRRQQDAWVELEERRRSINDLAQLQDVFELSQNGVVSRKSAGNNGSD